MERLGELAIDVHGGGFGREFGAMITWGAYTCMRPGETFAARFSRLNGDEYDVGAQYHSRLGRETPPKYGSTGRIHVPVQAQRAALDKPRRLGDDLIFRTKRGRQFRQGSLHRAWTPVRAAFMAELPPHHHLHARLARDPEDRLDFYELRHFGASYSSTTWSSSRGWSPSNCATPTAECSSCSSTGTRRGARRIKRIRRAYGDNVRGLRAVKGDERGRRNRKAR